MVLLIICFVLSIALSVGAGVLAHRRGVSVAGGPVGWGTAAARRFGAIPGALLILIVGYAVTLGVGLALGFLAKAVETSVDEPTFRWVYGHVNTGSKFTTANEKLTMLGNNPVIQLVVLVAGIVFVFAYRSRWWLPVVGLAVAVIGEKYAQKILAKVVDRGHPPAPMTLGTYPSGGVARILAVYGVVIVLAILVQPTLSRAWRAGLWTGVTAAAVAESFTRLYLSKHWLTDAVFGLPFGAVLLLTNVAAVAALAQLAMRGESDRHPPRSDVNRQPVP